MTHTQRYTGPELGALLREVRAELGEHATIHEANRVLQGGVAGFFRTEAFEVLASAPPRPQPRSTPAVPTTRSSATAQSPSMGAAGSATGSVIEQRLLADPDDAVAFFGHLGAGPVPGGAGGVRATDRSLDDTGFDEDAVFDENAVARLTAAMQQELTRAEPRRFSAEDLAVVDDDLDLDEPIAGALPGQNPNDGLGSTPGRRILERAEDISDGERLGTTLTQTRPPIALQRVTKADAPISVALAGLSAGTDPAATGRPSGAAAAAATTVSTATAVTAVNTVTAAAAAAPITAAPTAAVAGTTGAAGTGPMVGIPPKPAPPSPSELSVGTGPSPSMAAFWSELAELEQLLTPVNTRDALVQMLVGPLDVVIPLARRIGETAGRLEMAVLTDEVALTGFESSQLVENSRDLQQRIIRWRGVKQQGLAVIEAEGSSWGSHDDLSAFTPRLLGIIDRISRRDTVDVVRLGVRSLPPIDQIAEIIDSLEVTTTLDVALPPCPERLHAAVQAQIPIATVCGRPLTASLILALQAHRSAALTHG